MTAPSCGCGRPVNGAAICRACENDLARALETAAAIGADLDLAISRQARFGERGRSGHGSVLPFDERASAAAGALRNELSGWVRVLAGR